MKKYLLLLLVANSFIVANAESKTEKQPYLNKSFSGESINSVTAETSGGNISVNGVDASQSHVEVFATNNNGKEISSDEFAARVNADYDIDVSVNNSKLAVTAKPKHRITDWKKALNFSFKIYVPANVSTNLETSGGNIALSGLSGTLKLTTSGGNLDLNTLSGKINGTTSGGNVYIKNSKDDIDLTTSGGNVEAGNSTGHIKLSTSGGHVKMDDLKGNIDVSTSGGNIEGTTIDGDLILHTSGGNVSLHDLNGSLTTFTSAGNIDVVVKNPASHISISNSSGKVNLEIPRSTGINLKLNATKISTRNLTNFTGTNSTEEINGTVNGGGIPVSVDAGSGNINVTFN